MGTNSEKHRIAGTSFRQKEIKSLGTLNPDYQLNKSQLIKKQLVDITVYEYKFKSFKAELVPEPTNEHDPNAVKVIINGKHVGYIKKGSCSHIKKLLATNSIKSIAATIKGGNSKYVYCVDDARDKDSYEYSSDKGDIGVEIVIETTASSSAKNTAKRSTSAKTKAPAATDVTKQSQYEDIVKKGNLTKNKTKSYRMWFLILSATLILVGLLTVTYGIIGIISIALGILFACLAHTYKNILKYYFKD